ncbi:phosphatase PAP2 family protein [Candidatus Peregrinibacteria bacterium]|nr:phosphatase PAP2 family protein [Candidatus Peregrinibacteria bacterium]
MIKSRTIITILAAFILTWLSLLFDNTLLEIIQNNRIPLISQINLFVTDIGLFAVTSTLFAYAVFSKKYKEIVLIFLACLISVELAYLMKKTFLIHRPFVNPELEIKALTYATGYTFPSMHAAFSMALIPFLKRTFKSKFAVISLITFYLLIVISRPYLGVHYVSDVIFGGLIGYSIAHIILWLEKKYSLYEKIIFHAKTKKEVRRQITHVLTGILLIFLLKFDLLNAEILALVLVIGAILSVLSRHYKIPLIHSILHYFERGQDINRFPGKGAFFMILGIFLSIILFETNIAFAAITIMVIGDAVSPIVGIYFGNHKLPFNREKHYEGLLLAIVLTTLAAYTFVDFDKAFIAATGAMFLESAMVPRLDKIIDDNLIIPLVAGGILTLIS